MTRALRTAQLLTAAWLLLLGGCAAVAVWVPPGAGRTAFGDIFQCLLPLLVNGALLMNAITMQPHKQHDSRRTLYGYVDFSLLLCWWIYLYLLTVIPWQSIAIDDARYNQAYNVICTFENLVFVAGAIVLSAKAAGRWRRTYAHLAGAGAAYTFGSLLVNLSIYRGVYSTGSLYDLPIIASLLWLGTAGVVAYSSRSETSTSETKKMEEKSSGSAPRNEAVWTISPPSPWSRL